jgi:hypothetical protein
MSAIGWSGVSRHTLRDGFTERRFRSTSNLCKVPPFCKVNRLYRAYQAARSAHSAHLNFCINLFILLYMRLESTTCIVRWWMESPADCSLGQIPC